MLHKVTVIILLKQVPNIRLWLTNLKYPNNNPIRQNKAFHNSCLHLHFGTYSNINLLKYISSRSLNTI